MATAPENTLRSFVSAEKAGLDEVELDLHLSKDGALVVMHDPDVDRTTDGTGPIAGKTLAELRRLDAGDGERVPVFEEVVDAVTVPIQAEIKDVRAAQVLAKVLNARHLAGRVEVSSFHDEALAKISALVPGVRTVLIVAQDQKDVVKRARAVGATVVALYMDRIAPETVEQAHAAHMAVIGWVVDDQKGLHRARTLGLDGVTTNRPDIKYGAHKVG
ncbi:glycerophosphodiester phosphodiesterase family protein [Streptomyces sp. NPDC048717]|uniref:glycerophosphodiester phosphodiesterase n=1 Tax=Streptomyces sp. NPDC048717 TaxID=3154928 RepID=UPI003438B5EC